MADFLAVIIGGFILWLWLYFITPWNIFSDPLLKTSDILFFVVSGLGFISVSLVFIIPGGLGLINKLKSKTQRCLVCSKKGADFLVSEKKLGPFCRKHLLEKYSELFLRNAFNAVIVEFQPKSTSLSSVCFCYYPISEIDWGGNQREIIRSLLAEIKVKKCRECSLDASVLFVTKESSPWKKNGPDPQEEFIHKGEYYCKEHVLPLIISGLENCPYPFNVEGGLHLPYKEDGYQVTMEV